MGDASRLQQVFWNLLSNAVKFTGKGGRVQVILECNDSAAEVTVADSGQGIAPDFLPFVFERFRQADGTSTRSKPGLGLGLAIVRQIVELHGGVVTAFSPGVGAGASFSVRIPQAVVHRASLPARPAVGAPAAHRLSCPPDLPGLRVLIVDDEADAREMLRSTLETCGAIVRAAASVRECLALFDQESPDELLSDIGMPEEDGYSLIEQVRARPDDRGGDVPAIALTAYARAEDRTRALLAGFHGHVPKPVEPVELLAVVAAVARRRPERTRE